MINKLKLITAALSFAALSGCASVYYLEGKEYKDETSFQQATDQLNLSILANIVPLPSPVTERSLVYAYPSQKTLYDESVRRHTEAKGMAPVGIALDQYRNLSIHAVKASNTSGSAIKKRGIYPQVTILETDTMVNSIEPSENTDVLYYSEASIGAGQMFYASKKHGKQIFAFDRSGSTPEARTQALIEAVQAFAIRD